MSLYSGDTGAFEITGEGDQGGDISQAYNFSRTYKGDEKVSLDSDEEYRRCVETSQRYQAREALKSRVSDTDIPLYGDNFSGEPIHAHQVTLDFTPIPGVDDDEYLIQKCINFWEFINNEPRMKNMMAEPEKYSAETSILETVEATSSSSSIPTAAKCECVEKSDLKSNKKLKTAVGTLRALDPYLKDKRCQQQLPYYYKHKYRSQDKGFGDFNLEKESNTDVLKSVKVRKPCQCIEDGREFLAKSADDMASIMKEMEEFDKTHPKCMDPPGHAPTLITASMQRVPYSVYTKPPEKQICNLNIISEESFENKV